MHNAPARMPAPLPSSAAPVTSAAPCCFNIAIINIIIVFFIALGNRLTDWPRGMGCAESKMDSEDNVRRCKERRRLMKEAVYARHHLAAAHSAYCRSLRLTGSALLTFASGEPLAVSQHTPAVFLRAPAAAAIPKSPPLPPSPPPMSASSPHHQQPPPSSMSTASSHQQPPPPPIRRKKAIKLPHILSESSIKSSPTPNRHFHYNPAPNSTYSTTPSLVSSVWNWDSFYPPPSPPNSEYFDRLLNTTTANPDYDSHTDTENEEKSSIHTPHPNAWNRSDKIHNHLHSLSPSESEEEETEREEVHCCELGDNDHDHYTTTSCSSDEDEAEHLKSRSDFPKNEATTKATANPGYTNADMKSKVGSNSENDYNENRGSGNSDKRIMVRHKDFTEIVAAINEYFEKAASSGDQVSGILETGRAQLDQRFKQLRKTVYHSAGVLSKLRWSWTSKPPLGVKYQFEATSFVQSGGLKSLCSTVERLLAWEKKLYQEVKAREEVKFKHEKKLSSLQSQEYRGGHNTKLDKTKVSINKLQSLIVVTSQAVSTTSSAIVGLRDSDLVPQLVELCHGLMYMWRSMHQFHEIQNDIVQQVRSLITDVDKGMTTSELHKQATRDLESAVSAWHSSFCSLIKYQRDFLRALHGWFKLTLLPVNTEPTNGTRDVEGVFAFCEEWKHALERIPDTVASEAIKSFINVVHSISLKQAEEVKIKKRTEAASKELERKSSSLRHIERKYYQSYSTVGISLPDAGPDNSHLLDARDPLAEKKAEIATCQRLVEDEMIKHSKAVEVTRAMTLNNIQTGLPGVFQATTSFSMLMTEALEKACTRSYTI